MISRFFFLETRHTIQSHLKTFYYLWKRHAWWQHSKLNEKYQIDKILELLVIDLAVQREKLQQGCWFFPRLHIFSLSKAGLSSLLWFNWLGTYWSLGLCPRMTTGLFLMDPFFFFAVCEEKKKYKFVMLHHNTVRDFHLFWHEGLINEPSLCFINFRTIKLVRFLDPINRNHRMPRLIFKRLASKIKPVYSN